MRWLQNILILAAAIAFGFGLAVQVVFHGLALVFGQPKGENFGGAIIQLGFALAAGIVGAVIGLVSGVRWVTQHEPQPWPSRVWFGAVLGLAVGVLVTYLTSPRYYWWFWATRAAFFMPAFSVAGGLSAGLLGRKSSRPTPRRRRR